MNRKQPSRSMEQPSIYWTDLGGKKIQCANLDGSNVQDVVTGLVRPQDIAVDVKHGKLYWTENLGEIAKPNIWRANLDGSNIQRLITTNSEYPKGLEVRVKGIVVDAKHGKLYWTEIGNPIERIRRADLDGTNVQVVTKFVHPAKIQISSQIVVDAQRNKLYWASYRGGILQADLDSTEVQTCVRTMGLNWASSITVDVPGMLYWAGTDQINNSGKIQRIRLDRINTQRKTIFAKLSEFISPNLDNINIQDVLTGLGSHVAIAVDMTDRLIYWSETPPIRLGAYDIGEDKKLGRIRRANLDGINTYDWWMEDVVTGLDHPTDLVIVRPM